MEGRKIDHYIILKEGKKWGWGAILGITVPPSNPGPYHKNVVRGENDFLVIYPLPSGKSQTLLFP